MLFSQKSREGWLMIDHRAGPGITEEFACRSGVAEPVITPAGKVVEFATLTCSHCSTSQIKNPLRTRERGYCFRCNHYICDLCAAVRECRPFAQVVDDVLSGKTPVPLLAGADQSQLTIRKE